MEENDQEILDTRVVDPHWFDADPDPAFFLIADLDSEPSSESRVLMTKN